MNTWLILDKGKYAVVYSKNKPVIGSMVIAKVGEPIWEFDPGYVINDTTYLRIVSGFKVDEENNTIIYLLQDRSGKVTEVQSSNVGHIWPLLHSFWLWVFYDTNFS